MKFLLGAVIPAERTLIEQGITTGTDIVIPVRGIDGFKFITWHHFAAVPAHLAAVFAIGFPLEHEVICDQAAAFDAAPEFLMNTIRANIHRFPIHIFSIHKRGGFKTPAAAVAERKICIPAIGAQQMSVKFNRLIFSYILAAMGTNEVTFACTPDAHGLPGLGINNILIGKISAAALAFFKRFMSAIPAYMDIAAFDEMHFPLYDPVTTAAFTHDITAFIISIRLFACRRT
jgi:hypothetical protein